MSTCKCPSLFQPGKIGSMELKNRAVMPAICHADAYRVATII